MRIASATARFAHPEFTFGDVIYSPLHDLVGGAVARDLCLTGRELDAQEALALRLVSEVVPREGLEEAVARVVQWIDGAPRDRLLRTKAKAIATTALEMAADSEAIRSATNAVFDQWELLFVQRMRADGIALERARGIAPLIVAALEGALILARTRRRLEPLDRVAGLLADWIDAEAKASAATQPRPPTPARPRKASR